ncbi:MAG: Rrf2 family transcriptional regulator [Candidatus Eisenbacteria bacterium]|uniref:Rrf2 family transcriptional regulator n=1 Tax=Eiseniibacteriota bacterium TaxID=2212470 RepID=A0A948RWH2_UNCEI|nr:Rrf2 family transcriptional regulator [Candidatus Eisenbacteria bacterium]MBU1949692.1 Rrf2 family transcriptional regulator [Candidatus Eisenbacteria bacterium]MBU2692315.1 Rrf2 family transcriptional regulator [Candidatus Eisenbacteria bacterium]
MRISTRTRYGFRALAELAKGYPNIPISLKQISTNQNISLKYLEQVIATLKAAGIVRAVRGNNGGYLLTRPPAQMTLKDPFLALEGTPILLSCLDEPDHCSTQVICSTRVTWENIEKAILGVLDSTTIEDLRQQSLQPESPDYTI